MGLHVGLQVALCVEGLAAVLAGEPRRGGVGQEVTAQPPLRVEHLDNSADMTWREGGGAQCDHDAVDFGWFVV